MSDNTCSIKRRVGKSRMKKNLMTSVKTKILFHANSHILLTVKSLYQKKTVKESKSDILIYLDKKTQFSVIFSYCNIEVAIYVQGLHLFAWREIGNDFFQWVISHFQSK